MRENLKSLEVRTVLQHLEGHLGSMEGGWSKEVHGKPLPFKVVRFRNQPQPGISTYSSLGLSSALLDLSDGRRVRQELLFAAYERSDESNIPGLITLVGRDLLESGKALLRGQVLGPAGPLLPDSSLDALYSAIPVVFPRPLRVCASTDPATVFVWLIPIARDEAELVRTSGWNRFEEILEEADPDLFDIHRGSVIH